ncbi:MAG: biotin transporter BioY, partial [Planctomycetota bacterium]
RVGERVDAPAWMVRLAGMLTFTLLVGLGAQVAVPLPPFGVPQTLQTLVVALAAMGLGARWGAASMALYMVMGWVGAGIFAEGSSGPAVIFGQTGGYLLGFVLAQPVIAGLIRRRDGTVRGWGALTVAMLAGHGVIFAVGVPWLAVAREIAVADAFYGGCVIFLPGMVAKTAAAVLIGLAVWPSSVRRFW